MKDNNALFINRLVRLKCDVVFVIDVHSLPPCCSTHYRSPPHMSVPNATPQRAGHAPASSSQQSFAPRSSTIPLSMGHSQSKPVPPLPSSSPATKGFNAAVAGGIRLKRAFAGRRKKSEEQDSKPTVAPRIESSVSAPPQVRVFSLLPSSAADYLLVS